MKFESYSNLAISKPISHKNPRNSKIKHSPLLCVVSPAPPFFVQRVEQPTIVESDPVAKWAKLWQLAIH
jgi:hypothetical protein